MCQARVEDDEDTRQLSFCSHGVYSLEGKTIPT